MKKAAIIFNPSSGRERSNYYKNLILNKINDQFDYIEVRETKGKHDATVFSRYFTDNYFDSIFVVGGDGTFNEAIKGILESESTKRPKIGLIPGGTGNIFSSVLGFSRFAKIAIDQIDLNHTKLLDVGRINNDNFNMLFSIGDVPESIHNVSIEQKSEQSMIAYVKSMLKGAAKNNHYNLKISIEDKIYSGTFSHVVIMTSHVLERFSPIDLNETTKSGFLHIFMLKESDLYEIAAVLPDIMMSRLNHNENIIYECAKHLEIQAIDQIVETDIDGDNGDDLPARLRVLENAIEVYIPKTFSLI